MAARRSRVSLVDFTQTSNGDADEVAYDSANQRLVGGTNSANPGLTLYVFDSDLGSAGSTCNDSCAENWPPVAVTDGEVDNISGLGLITRDDGSSQAAYKAGHCTSILATALPETLTAKQSAAGGQ